MRVNDGKRERERERERERALGWRESKGGRDAGQDKRINTEGSK